MNSQDEPAPRAVVGGVDTHKDLHVAAVVNHQDRVLGTRSFASTRQGYRQMLAWMRSFGELQRVGMESTGSYGAGLLRFMQQAGVTVLEVTAPDKQDRRKVAYRLTEKGLALLPVLIALRQWGERWVSGMLSNPVLVDRRDRQPVAPVAVHAADGRPLSLSELEWVDRGELTAERA